MISLEILQTVFLVLLFIAGASSIRLLILLKQANCWQPVKAFGFEIYNWGFHGSIAHFWKQRAQVDPIIRKKIYFHLVFGPFCFMMTVLMLLLSAFKAPTP
ncbi:hypothetical protein [Gimesia sp.]|uniref:hypothetical protein n=1 Tax=Gimesia sp. TaxID=2024833 RepID=UPI0032ED8D82